jgi:putative flippase GtrA
MRRGIGEIIRFAGVGLLATATHSGVYLLLAGVIAPQLANLAGYLAAVSLSYIGHLHVTFRGGGHSKTAGHKRPLRFAAVSLFGLLLNAGFVMLTTQILQAPPSVAAIFMISVTPVVTYILLKFWVY